MKTKKRIIISLMSILFIVNIDKSLAVYCSNCYNVGQGNIDFAKQAVIASSVAATKISASVSAAANLALKVKAFSLDRIASNIAQNSINSIEQEMSNYINTGFEGKPLFVENIDELSRNIAEDQMSLIMASLRSDDSLLASNRNVAKLLIEGVNEDADFKKSITPNIGKTLCNKLSSDLDNAKASRNTEIINMAQEQYNNSCVSGDKVSQYKNQESCISDFSCGGFDSILAITRNFSLNTEQGRLETAKAEYEENVKDKIETIDKELNRSGGFLNQKECIKYENVEGGKVCVEEKTVTPGAAAASMLDQIVKTPVDRNQQVDGTEDVVKEATNSFISKFTTSGIGSIVESFFSNVDNFSDTESTFTSGVGATTVDGVTNYGFVENISATAIANSNTLSPPAEDPKYNLDAEGYKTYMEGYLQIINAGSAENTKAKTFAEKELASHKSVFTSYQTVVTCYKDGINTKATYPNSIPLTIRQRGEVLNSKIRNLESVISDSSDVSNFVGSTLKLMSLSVNLNTLDYYRDKIDRQLDSVKSLKNSDWELRDLENTYGPSGTESDGLYFLLAKESSETLSNIVYTDYGEGQSSSDISPLAACKSINNPPVDTSN